MLTPRQVQWAARHCWFVRDNGDGTITIRDAGWRNGVFIDIEMIWEHNFDDLHSWAGY
jgi:hypothetical protein